MNLRNILLPAGLAVFMAGCVVNPRPYPPGGYDQRYDVDYYDYRSTPSYEGYYYVRIIFIRNVPYYVDDDRYIRPIPPRLYDHFRRYPYNTLGRPPVFSRDTEVREGYPVSRIIYLDGVPYHVGNDRIAQPLPERLQPRFRYTPSSHGNAPANANRPQPSGQRDNGRNNEPPVNVRNQDRERIQQPPIVRGQPEGGSNASADTNGRTTPSPDRSRLPQRQGQPTAGGSQADTTNGQVRDRNGNRPQAIDETAKKETGKKEADKNADKKESRDVKKDKQGDSTKSDDRSDKKDNGKNPRNGRDDDQGGNDRGNGNGRD